MKRFAVIVTLVVVCGTVARAEWRAGEQVFPKTPETSIRDDSGKVLRRWDTSSAKVLKVDGDRLEVRHQISPGPYRGGSGSMRS